MIGDSDRFKHDRSSYERPSGRFRCGRESRWNKPCHSGPGPDGFGVLPEDVEALRTVLKEFLWGDVKHAADAPFPDVDLITAVNDAPAGSDCETVLNDGSEPQSQD